MGFYNVSYCFEDLSQYVIINQVKICKNKFYSLVVSNLYSKSLVFKKFLRFLLIACDGLWKSFPPNEAVHLTHELLMQEIKKYENEHRESQNGQVSQVDFDL